MTLEPFERGAGPRPSRILTERDTLRDVGRTL